MKRELVLILAFMTVAGATSTRVMAETPSATQGGPVPQANVAGKKLIRWAAELTAKTSALDVPAKVKGWQESGYDGLCFSISSHADGSARDVLLSAAKSSMFFRWWCLVKRTREEFVPEIEAFKSADWGRLTDNFILTQVRPFDGRCPDWFNDKDFEIILSNARLVARIAREIGFKGIVLDTEEYAFAAKGPWSYPWSYSLYRSDWYASCGHAEPLPFVEVAAKVRERGRQYAQALSEEFPDIVLLVAAGFYEYPWQSCNRTGEGLSEVSMGLFPAFVDGVLVGLSDEALLVSLNEKTYVMSEYGDMVKMRNIAKEQALVLSTVPELARRRISFAAGLWTDRAPGGGGFFSNTDPEANHRNPRQHEHATANALAVSDHYAWHYGEGSYFLRWGEARNPFVADFDKEYDEPPALIREYWRANERGHLPHDLSWAPEPDFDRSDYGEFDADAARRNNAFWTRKEKEGYEVALKLPEHWKFLYDPQHKGRTENWDRLGWLEVSAKKCWQSQGIPVNGRAWYEATFDVPANLDAASHELFLTLSVGGSGAVDIYLNDVWIGYWPKNPMIDVTTKLRRGEKNTLALNFLNKTGPGGLAGDVKILARKKGQD